jgi:hypothetical protein
MGITNRKKKKKKTKKARKSSILAIRIAQGKGRRKGMKEKGKWAGKKG